MLIFVQDLKKGDLVLYPANGKFIMGRLLKDPEINPTPKSWLPTDKTYYKNIKMSCRRETVERSRKYGNHEHKWKEHTFILTADDHNYNKYFEPNGKQFWLLERKEL